MTELTPMRPKIEAPKTTGFGERIRESSKNFWKTIKAKIPIWKREVTTKPDEIIQQLADLKTNESNPHKNAEVETITTTENQRQRIKFEQLPENLQGLAPYLLSAEADIFVVKKPEGRQFIFSYVLSDRGNMFPGQTLKTEVSVFEDAILPKSLEDVSIQIAVNNGSDVNASDLPNPNSTVRIALLGGVDFSKSGGQVTVDRENNLSMKINKINTTTDLVVFAHESRHTHQPPDIIKAANPGELGNSELMVYFADVMEVDAWRGTEDNLHKLG